MSSLISDTADAVSRVPWKIYLKTQLYKLLGFFVLAILVIGVMILSNEIDLETSTSSDTIYLVAVAFSSLCFILVLVGFSKVILFDMAGEFGLRDEETNKMMYNARFFLFASLALSFCSAIYLLLDVFLQDTYLELLPVLLMEWVLITAKVDIPGLTDIGGGREFYQTVRNLYFGFFFLIIITFSVFVFLTILTSLGRKRITSRFQKEELENEEEENKRLYKLLVWFAIPFLATFLLGLANTSIGPIIIIILIILVVWWLYQVLKFLFLVFWKGFKVTAFITSVNALLIIPLILVLYLAPVFTWTIWSIIEKLQNVEITFDLPQLIQAAVIGLETNYNDFVKIIQLDYVFITIIATFIVGFAEGFALVAIFTAIYKGAEVARSGRIIARSPPKVAVITKYLAMLTIWLGISWDSFREIWNMLIEEFHISLPPIEIPSFFFTIYNKVIIPLSEYLEQFLPFLQYIPILIIPLYFILAGAFKFLSVTLITPRVKDRISVFFLLISTAFVLIITNILGDLYEIQAASDFTGVQDAPLRSFFLVTDILSSIVGWFEYIEAIAFYFGLIFGIMWIISKIIRARRERKVEFKPKKHVTPLETKLGLSEDSQSESDEISKDELETIVDDKEDSAEEIDKPKEMNYQNHQSTLNNGD
ncbi:MAG: hypothetical protein ACW97X_12110 [Candidatus Hodarchaeales archaeon]|jgi:hypothetical protein